MCGKQLWLCEWDEAKEPEETAREIFEWGVRARIRGGDSFVVMQACEEDAAAYGHSVFSAYRNIMSKESDRFRK